MKESEIRNINVLNEYLKLVEKDVKSLFDFNSFVTINCPSCLGNSFVSEFRKSGFQYVSCRDCHMLFVNPRPPFAALNKFYSDSPSTNFWVEKFFKPMAESRRDKVFRPRAEYACKIFDTKKGAVIGDIGAGFGLFLEELRRILPFNEYIAIEPSLQMSNICEKNGFKVKRLCLEEICDMEDKFDALTAFELVEHLFDPAAFLKKAHSLLKPGGHLFFTTLNAKGFDILVLWEKSKSVSPPHHLNFFNPSAIKILLERLDFDIVEISTPGKLDWDIVENMIKDNAYDAGRFWNYLSHEGNETCKRDLQNWISENNLSSHMRVLVRRKII